jgi:hypothetical protein
MFHSKRNDIPFSITDMLEEAGYNTAVLHYINRNSRSKNMRLKNINFKSRDYVKTLRLKDKNKIESGADYFVIYTTKPPMQIPLTK